MGKSHEAQAARNAVLSETTVYWVRPWVGQALTSSPCTLLNWPRQLTLTDSKSCGVMSTKVSKWGALTCRSMRG